MTTYRLFVQRSPKDDNNWETMQVLSLEELYKPELIADKIKDQNLFIYACLLQLFARHIQVSTAVLDGGSYRLVLGDRKSVV